MKHKFRIVAITALCTVALPQLVMADGYDVSTASTDKRAETPADSPTVAPSRSRIAPLESTADRDQYNEVTAVATRRAVTPEPSPARQSEANATVDTSATDYRWTTDFGPL